MNYFDTLLEKYVATLSLDEAKSKHSISFISQFSCEEYFKYNRSLLVYDRRQEIVWEFKLLN